MGPVDRFRPSLAFGVLAVALAASSPAPSQAGARAGSLGVRCTVAPSARASIDYQAADLAITADDVARGYVDVTSGSRLTVTTNSRSGYVVDFLTRLPIFRSVHVRAAGANGDIGADGGTLVERGATGRALRADIAYRFTLAPNVRPGVYPWPLALVVRPL